MLEIFLSQLFNKLNETVLFYNQGKVPLFCKLGLKATDCVIQSMCNYHYQLLQQQGWLTFMQRLRSQHLTILLNKITAACLDCLDFKRHLQNADSPYSVARFEFYFSMMAQVYLISSDLGNNTRTALVGRMEDYLG